MLKKLMDILTIYRETGTQPLDAWVLLNHVSIKYVNLKKKIKEEYSEAEYHELAIHKITGYDCEVQIFKDGLKRTNE